MSDLEAFGAAISEREAIPARLVGHGTLPVEAGLYAWYADSVALDELRAEVQIATSLIYVGQAGATREPSGIRSDATLDSRIRTNHLSGSISGSTFRKTLAALLQAALELQVDGAGSLAKGSEAALSSWMRAHLSVAVLAVHDRDALGGIEDAVLGYLAPPLNLMHMPSSPARTRLRLLRSRLQSASGKAEQGPLRAGKPRKVEPVGEEPTAALPADLDAVITQAIAGDPIRSLDRGNPNWVTAVDRTHLWVETNASKAKGTGSQPIPLEWVISTYRTLRSQGFLSRTDLGYQASHRSALIFAVLAQLPDVSFTLRPIRLMVD